MKLPIIQEYIYTFLCTMRMIKIREIKVKFTTREIYLSDILYTEYSVFRIRSIEKSGVSGRWIYFSFSSLLVDKQMSRKVENNATYEKMLEQAEPRLVRWGNNTRKH